MKRQTKSKPALEVAELYPPQGQWTEENYFALPDTNRYVELSDGRLIVPPHPTYRHQAALEELYIRLRTFVQERDLGEAHVAPLPVRLWPGKVREPDIFFLAKEHADRIGEQVCGVPDVTIEVISPGTRSIDRVEKFAEYARAGVREYWLVDLDEKTIEVYVLRDGAYSLSGKYGSGQIAASKVLSGFRVMGDEVLARGG